MTRISFCSSCWYKHKFVESRMNSEHIIYTPKESVLMDCFVQSTATEVTTSDWNTDFYFHKKNAHNFIWLYIRWNSPSSDHSITARYEIKHELREAGNFTIKFKYIWSLRLSYNGRDSVSNHQPHDCLLNRLFRRRSKKTSKLRVTGLCAGNSPATGEFPAQRARNAENVSVWWRHNDMMTTTHSSAHPAFNNDKFRNPAAGKRGSCSFHRRNFECSKNFFLWQNSFFIVLTVDYCVVLW